MSESAASTGFGTDAAPSRASGRPLGATGRGDERGVVYVEFVFAFVPVFMVFLAICQTALVASATLVVRHAALAGARSAIVVLEEPPEEFDRAPRGTLSRGRPGKSGSSEAVLVAMGLGGFRGGRIKVSRARRASNVLGARRSGRQQGARMVPIRSAAELPLLALAPNERQLGDSAVDNLQAAVTSGFGERLAASLAFTRAASLVTVHQGPGTDELAPEPIGSTAAVTVRVTYVYLCAVPMVRTLMCRTIESLLADPSSPLAVRRRLGRGFEEVRKLAGKDARFVALAGEATLPNQGADYYRGAK